MTLVDIVKSHIDKRSSKCEEEINVHVLLALVIGNVHGLHSSDLVQSTVDKHRGHRDRHTCGDENLSAEVTPPTCMVLDIVEPYNRVNKVNKGIKSKPDDQGDGSNISTLEMPRCRKPQHHQSQGSADWVSWISWVLHGRLGLWEWRS